MAKTKYIMHDCAYCHKSTKMELVGEMQKEGDESPAQKVWYRCTRCKHSALLDKQSLVQTKRGEPINFDRSSCTTYSKELVYSVGQMIYHSEWDDVGKVLAKRKTSDGTQSITVAFEKLGERRLIENLAPSIEPEITEIVPAQL